MLLLSAVALTTSTFFNLKSKDLKAMATSAYFQTNGGLWNTIFKGATKSIYTTVATNKLVYFFTGSDKHREYATKGTSKPLFMK